MLKLDYPRPIHAGNLPALGESFYRLKARLKRRKTLDAVCQIAAMLLHAPLMALAALGFAGVYLGKASVAWTANYPWLQQALDFVLRTLPERWKLPGEISFPSLTLSLPLPELLCLVVALVLPVLVCVLLALLLRLLIPAKATLPYPAGTAEEEILRSLRRDAPVLAAEGRRSRRSVWPRLSALLSTVLCFLSVVQLSADYTGFQKVLFLLLVTAIVFSFFHAVAVLVDEAIASFALLRRKWDAIQFLADLDVTKLEG